MDFPIPTRRPKNGDPSPNGDGLVYWRDTNKKGRWVTPDVLEQKQGQANAQARAWRRKNPGAAKSAFYRWLAKPGSLEIKREAYRKWLATDEGRNKRREVSARHRNTPNGMLCNRVRSRIAAALKRGYTQSASTLELIGCSIQKLRLHIESQFKDGMSWQNQCLWEIHHRIPIAYYDLNDPRQQREAFNWKNQEPRWIADNRTMSDTLDGELFRARDIRKTRKPHTQTIIPFKQKEAA